MNAPEKVEFLVDVQAQRDDRRLSIDAVGIKDVRHPIVLRGGDRDLPTIATFCMTVGLPAAVKGTHMSRFVECLQAQPRPFDQRAFKAMMFDMLDRLDARTGCVEMRFPYFVVKTAPVSRVQSQLDYDVCWRGEVTSTGRYSFSMHVAVPATGLCPCSKEISAYGAHNQRSLIGIEVELAAEMTIEELVAIAERSASCDVYGLLKRPDEKYVTERAYDNPKFVEDLVRDGAQSRNPRRPLCRRSGELRVDPQPLGVRPHRRPWRRPMTAPSARGTAARREVEGLSAAAASPTARWRRCRRSSCR